MRNTAVGIIRYPQKFMFLLCWRLGLPIFISRSTFTVLILIGILNAKLNNIRAVL